MGRVDGDQFVGWLGRPSNSSLSLAEFFSNANIANISQAVKSVHFFVNGELRENQMEIVPNYFNYPTGDCLIVKIRDFAEGESDANASLKLMLNKMKNSSVSLKISDPNREHFLPNIFSFSGDGVAARSEAGELGVFRLQVTETRELERDPRADCRQYSGHQGDTFRQCVETVTQVNWAGQ